MIAIINRNHFNYELNTLAPTLFQLRKHADMETVRAYLEQVKTYFPDIIRSLEIQAAAVESVPCIETVIQYYGSIAQGLQRTRNALSIEKVNDLIHDKMLHIEGTANLKTNDELLLTFIFIYHVS